MEQKKKVSLFGIISLEVLLITSLFLVSLFVFGWLARMAMADNGNTLDQYVFALAASISTPGFLNVMETFTFFGSANFLIPAYFFVSGILLAKKKYRYAIEVLVIGVSSSLVMFGMKEVFHRNRPDMPVISGIINTYSFPSGHTLSSFIFCSLLVYLISRLRISAWYKWIAGVLLILFSLTIAVSRIALRVHYPSDIIAGFCLGIVWAIFSFYVLEKINKNLARRRENRKNIALQNQ